MKPAKKIFSLLGGKIKFELALQPSTPYKIHHLLKVTRENSKQRGHWWPSFASDKFEKILGAGHAQQETYIVKFREISCCA